MNLQLPPPNRSSPSTISPLAMADIAIQWHRTNSTSNYDELTQAALIFAFSLLICFGTVGNGLVCYVVAKNPAMRTPHNIFIINLAISDLTLCLFTQPLNLMKVCNMRWNLGSILCKFVPMCAGTNVFVSTISITAIALDRFQVIVYPMRNSMTTVGAVMSLFVIWGISLLMASPLLIFNEIHEFKVDEEMLFATCVEDSGMVYEKGAYSISSLIFQYIVPILILACAHMRISFKLKYRTAHRLERPASGIVMSYYAAKTRREKAQRKATNLLLVMIAIVFAASWMPLNFFNIIADFSLGSPVWHYIDEKGLIFPICHLLVLCSACMNPVLYGWLNENFRHEFRKVVCWSCLGRMWAVSSKACEDDATKPTVVLQSMIEHSPIVKKRSHFRKSSQASDEVRNGQVKHTAEELRGLVTDEQEWEGNHCSTDTDMREGLL